MFNAQCTWVQKEAKKSFREEREIIQNHFFNNEMKTISWKSFSPATRRRRKKSEKNLSIFRFEKWRRKILSPILRGELGTEHFFTDCFWPLPSFTNPALMQQVSIVWGWAVLPELLSSFKSSPPSSLSLLLFHLSHGHGDQNLLYMYSVLLPG